ncbi:PREDICTED: uncharacterized protein LOC104599106 isoform X2 [Nelumbo nucifera]|uniref:Uncharacterized protein LOC104599106 isoform X2 n=2 Tax=Nelumbo nucifera TaxID=4432 RepID=A0A1U8A0V2_NELNU|nr:PREDICTED: uncharacterized protein LOC104599106 isoform X2 [Nelumbo nucifera]DAD35036.1 TPA_asm: hypothetical protein HUJ06_005676 [Nelumbo nucifera]
MAAPPENLLFPASKIDKREDGILNRIDKKTTTRRPGENHHLLRDKPCDICGSIGYIESLATCTKCNVAHEHIYCMRNNLRALPVMWFCETCRLNPYMVSLESDAKGCIPSKKVKMTDADAGPKNPGAEEKKQLVILPKLNTDCQNNPALYSTWKGSFEICDRSLPGEFYDGFQAHPPEKVSRKAYEASKKMPGILQFKLQPRQNVWSEIFHKCPPAGNDVALYFFPGDFYRSKEMYNSLYDLIERDDLMMLSSFNGLELLIFTSRELPVDLQRINMPFFLWGIFRVQHIKEKINHVQELCSSSVPPLERLQGNHEDNDNPEVIDMEVDMVGGKDVGRVDIPVKRFITGGTITLGSSPKIKIEKCSGIGVLGLVGTVSGVDASEDPFLKPLLKVKREWYNNLDAPPGFPRHVISKTAQTGPLQRPVDDKELTVTGVDASEGPLQKPLMKVPVVRENLHSKAPHPLSKVKREWLNNLDAPPGFPRHVISQIAQTGSFQRPTDEKESTVTGVDASEGPLQKPFMQVPAVQDNLHSKTPHLLSKVKREWDHNLDAPPGFPRRVIRKTAQAGSLLRPPVDEKDSKHWKEQKRS